MTERKTRLEDIGFYTLSDERALNTNAIRPLARCELVLTGDCNFKCTYCRGLTNPSAAGTISHEDADAWVKYWISEKLQNIRFTGGEPLLYPRLRDLVRTCADAKIRVAISTNGSAPLGRYEELISDGVSDLSVSLDAGCNSTATVMSGGVPAWERVVENIRQLSKLTYVTIGMVFTKDNVRDCVSHVLFASSLGPADIRVIPSAQYGSALERLDTLPNDVLNRHPILKYRVQNLRSGRPVRGLRAGDCHRCWLAFDDMACAHGYHFPCVIHLREGGDPIGKLSNNVRRQREEWVLNHDSFLDDICRKNCLDVCVDYNNTAMRTHDEIRS